MIVKEEKFGKMYKYAKKVLTKEEFYLNLLEQCYSNKRYLDFIILANDILEISPVEVFIKLYKDDIKKYEKGDEIEDKGIRKAIGAFFGYVFREKFNKEPKRSVRVGALGISKAMIYE